MELSKAREEQLRKSFSYVEVDFHYPDDVPEFETLIESFKEENNFANNLPEDMRENRELDRLIVMDDVSGLADKSSELDK